MIRLTAKGHRLEQTVRDHAQAADRQIEELLGTRRYTQLVNGLQELAGKITANS